MNCPPNVFAYNAPCAPSMGGVSAVLIANPDDVTLVANLAAGTATLDAVTPGAKPFYRWEVAPKQSTLTTSAQIDAANNNRYFATDLAAVLNGFDPTSAGADLLERLTRALFIVECKNGKAYLVGFIGTPGASDRYPVTGTKLARGADITGFEWTPGQNPEDAVRASISAHVDAFVLPLVVSSYSNLVNV